MKRIVFFLMAALLTASCSKEKKAEMRHSVFVVKPTTANGTEQKHFAGQVKEAADVNLGFKTAGQIIKIYVREGQHVGKGQLLAQLDDKDYQLGVRAAQAQYDQLKHEVERLTKLYEKKSVSGNDYEKATAGLEQVGVNLENNLNKVKYTKLYAPQSGIIQKVNFEVMEMVNAGTPVVNILYTNGMLVEVNLPTATYLQRDRFNATQCEVNGKRYSARLQSIVPKADNTQLYKATFAIDGAGKDVVAGMNVDVIIDISNGQDEKKLAVPVNSVFESDGKSYVWVVGKDSVVSRREVSLGEPDERGRVSIASGLSGEETIVKAGVHALQDNERVKIISEDTETNTGAML